MTPNPLLRRPGARASAALAPALQLTALLLAASFPASAQARTLTANPSAGSGQAGYYLTLVGQLTPGDTLYLPAGTYGQRLNLDGLQGTASNWIVIMGPASGAPAVITTSSTCCNDVQLGGNAYLALVNLTVDSAGIDAIDGINAKGNPTHDILVQGCTLIGQNSSQGTIGISTKSPAWRWTIRGNRIIEAGTGIYLGNSDGTQPFIAGVIEGNLFQNTIGYNMEIKNQVPYDTQGWASQIPAGPNRTIIRDNVFIKEKNDWLPSQTAGARPNLLVDPFPDSGLGSSDLYEVYGNFFYKNPAEALFQGSGRIALHDNVFVASGAGMVSAYFTDHNGALKLAHVYNNTVYSASGGGIILATSARQGDAVIGNLVVTSGTALGGSITNSSGNLVGAVASAASYFTSPSEVLGQMDFYPSTTCAGCNGSPLDMSAFTAETAYDRDFNGASKSGFTFRGAYAGQGVNPGWRLQADLKSSGPPDVTPPGPIRDARATN